MSATVFLALLSFSSYVVTLPLIREAWRLSNAESAALFSAYLVGLAVASLVLVPLTDRYRSESFVLGGTLVLVVSHLAFGWLARGFASAAALRVLAGAGHVAVYFPGIRLVSRRFAARGRGAAIATFVAAGYLGTTLSYTLTGTILARVDAWQTAYTGAALVSAAAVPLAWVVLRRPAPALEARGRGLVSVRPLHDRPIALVLASYGLHSAELYLARLWLPLLLGALLVRHGEAPNLAAAKAGSIAGLMFSTGVVGVFLGGALSDRIGRTTAAIGIFALSGTCSFVLGAALEAPLPLAMTIGFLYGLFTSADASIYATAVTELSPAETLGSALALQSCAGFLAGAAAPVLGGFVLDAVAGDVAWGLTFGLNGCLAILGILALVALRRAPRSAEMAGGKH